jgi:hypothetical protein
MKCMERKCYFNSFPGNVVITSGHFVDGDAVTLHDGDSNIAISGAPLSIQDILQTLGSSAL